MTFLFIYTVNFLISGQIFIPQSSQSLIEKLSKRRTLIISGYADPYPLIGELTVLATRIS